MSHHTIRILVLEDEVPAADEMKFQFGQVFEERQLRSKRLLEPMPGWMRFNWTHVTNVTDFHQRLTSECFSFSSIDLRVPEVEGGLVRPEAKGLLAFRHAQPKVPCLPAAIYTQFTPDHLNSLKQAGALHLAFWQKAAADGRPDADVPVLTPRQWAERTWEWLSPYGPAQRHVLERAVPWLPKALAETADQLKAACAQASDQHLSRRDSALAANWRSNFAREGLWQLCRLAEQCKEWLWSLLVARMCWGPVTNDSLAAQRDVLRHLAKDGWADKDSVERQDLKEAQINDFLAALELSEIGGNPLLISHLGGGLQDNKGSRPIVTSFKALRLLRNRLAHQSTELDYSSEWDKVALHFYRVLDLVAYFAANPILCDVQHQTDGYYKAKLLDALLPRTIDCKVLSLWESQSGAQPLARQTYTLWPESPGQVHLLSLSPWVDRRPSASGGMDTYFFMGRSPQGKPRDLHSYTWESVADIREQSPRIDLLNNLLQP